MAKLSTEEFMNKSKNAIIELIKDTQIVTVWYCKTIQNHKGIFAHFGSGKVLLFECTYNGDKDELYVDEYNKINKVIVTEVSKHG